MSGAAAGITTEEAIAVTDPPDETVASVVQTGSEKIRTRQPTEIEEPTRREAPSIAAATGRETPLDPVGQCGTRSVAAETRSQAAETWPRPASPAIAIIVLRGLSAPGAIRCHPDEVKATVGEVRAWEDAEERNTAMEAEVVLRVGMEFRGTRDHQDRMIVVTHGAIHGVTLGPTRGAESVEVKVRSSRRVATRRSDRADRVNCCHSLPNDGWVCY